jgi:hypothetical protein
MAKRMGSFGGALLTIALAYILLVGCTYVFQQKLIYHPSGSAGPFRPADFHVPEMTAIELRTADGLTLTAWYAASKQERPTMVYFHGNGGHIGWRGPKVRPYLDAGMGVLLLTYRGYSGNPGDPTEAGLYNDARAALSFLSDRGVMDGQLIFYGESLGTGVAVEMARGRQIAALVLEAPMTSIVDVGQSTFWFLPVRWLAKEQFASATKIGEILAPILFVHGEYDRIIPIRFGRELFTLASEPKTFETIADAGHNDLYDHGADRAVLAFLRRNLDF